MTTRFSIALIAMLAHGMIAAADAIAPLTVFAPQTPFQWTGGELDTAMKRDGKPTVRWEHAKATQLNFYNFPSNWKGEWNLLEIWLHANAEASGRFLLYIGSENPQSDGMDYFSQQIPLDFKGWKQLLFPLNDLQVNRNPLGLDRLTSLYMAATGFLNNLNPKVVLHIGGIRLIKGTIPKEVGPRITDEMFYQKLNLELPGLEAVKAAVEKQDYAQAEHAFAAYLKQRKSPRMYKMWSDRPSPEQQAANTPSVAANNVLAHKLSSCEFEYQFGERINWFANPTPQKYHEWTWQLNRHGCWPPLVDAYLQTGQEKYGREFVKQMREWVEDCPVPVNNTGNWPYSVWRTITTGIRSFGPWPYCFFCMLGSPVFDDNSIVLMVKSFYEHAEHLRAHPTSNNWLAMEMNGLYHIATLFPEFKKSQEWGTYAIGRLYQELDNQIYPDGAQKELAPGYHGVSLGNFLSAYRIGKFNNASLPEDYCQRLERQYTYYLNIRMPDGRCPALNDSLWNGTNGSLGNAFTIFPEHTDFQYVTTDGAIGTPPSFTSVWMPYAGWGIMRSGWDKEALYMHVDVGPFGAAHQHEDKLSLIACAYGRMLLTEGACYAYDSTPWRRYTLAAEAHNVVNVDGLTQNRRGAGRHNVVQEPLTNRWISNPTLDYIEGCYNEGFGPKCEPVAVHRRAVLFVKPEYWLVLDLLVPQDDKPHTYESMFHLDNVEAILEEQPRVIRGNDSGVANLAIHPVRPEGLEAEIVKGRKNPVQGWTLRQGYFDIHPIPTAIYKRQAAGTLLEPWLLYPLRPGQQSPVKTLRMTAPSTIELTFTDGRKHAFAFDIENGNFHSFSLVFHNPDGSLATTAVFE